MCLASGMSPPPLVLIRARRRVLVSEPLFRGSRLVSEKSLCSECQLTELAVSHSVASLVDISVDNISLDTLPENRITSASAMRTLLQPRLIYGSERDHGQELHIL
jgi:hypothetical protein